MIAKILLTYFFISILIAPILITIGQALADNYWDIDYVIGVILQCVGVVSLIIDVIIIFYGVIKGIITVIWE